MNPKRQDFQENALESLVQIDKYNRWIISKFDKYLGKNILELGSGLGNITIKIKEKGFNIVPTDINRYFLSSLKKITRDTFYLNVLDVDGVKRGQFDTIIAINVLEHIDDDIKALGNIYKLLPKKGVFVILVPAHDFLFGSYDKFAKHYHRYSKQSLYSKLSSVGFKIEEIGYYNKISAFGWFINGRLLKKREFPSYQLYIFNFLVPLLDFIDWVIPFDFGISIICIARKC